MYALITVCSHSWSGNIVCRVQHLLHMWKTRFGLFHNHHLWDLSILSLSFVWSAPCEQWACLSKHRSTWPAAGNCRLKETLWQKRPLTALILAINFPLHCVLHRLDPWQVTHGLLPLLALRGLSGHAGRRTPLTWALASNFSWCALSHTNSLSISKRLLQTPSACHTHWMPTTSSLREMGLCHYQGYS